MYWCCFVFFFFFKQKTAYEMRISYWSSDVCSSDLVEPATDHLGDQLRILRHPVIILGVGLADRVRKTGARRIDEDDVGHVEQGVGIVDDRIGRGAVVDAGAGNRDALRPEGARSEEHTSELQSLMRNSYAVFCLKKKTNS